MEDSLSTILYIIIAIGYFVFSILRKNKPQKKPNNLPQGEGQEYDENIPGQGQQQRRPSFEDLLREFTQEVPEINEVPETKEVIQESTRPVVQEVIPASTPKESPYSKFQKINFEPSIPKYVKDAPVKILKESKIKTKPQTNLAKLIRKQGGLKQAVVLSEVLKTKYF